MYVFDSFPRPANSNVFGIGPVWHIDFESRLNFQRRVEIGQRSQTDLRRISLPAGKLDSIPVEHVPGITVRFPTGKTVDRGKPNPLSQGIALQLIENRIDMSYKTRGGIAFERNLFF